MRAECLLCGRSWEHDSETKKCFWCGNESFSVAGEDEDQIELFDEDEITLPGWKGNFHV